MAVVSPRFCSQLLRGRAWWQRSGIPTVLRSTSLWSSLVAPQWYLQAEFGGAGVVSSSWPSVLTPQWSPLYFAVSLFVAEFGDTAVIFPWFCGVRVEFGGAGVVSPRFCSQHLRGRVWCYRSGIPTVWGQHLRGRVWWHRSGIPTVLRSTSVWLSLVAAQWYPHGFAVNLFAAEFGGTAVVSPQFCSQHLRGRVWWHGSGIPTVLQLTSVWLSLVAAQWYPHGFAVNLFAAEFGGPAMVSSRFFGQHLCGQVC